MGGNTLLGQVRLEDQVSKSEMSENFLLHPQRVSECVLSPTKGVNDRRL